MLLFFFFLFLLREPIKLCFLFVSRIANSRHVGITTHTRKTARERERWNEEGSVEVAVWWFLDVYGGMLLDFHDKTFMLERVDCKDFGDLSDDDGWEGKFNEISF